MLSSPTMGGAKHDEPVTPTPRFPRDTGKREKLSGAREIEPTDIAEDERPTPKQSGMAPRMAPRMPSDRPGERTRLPAEVCSPLPEDPEEAARDHRVNAMRELYAAGDMDAALFIAQLIDPSPAGAVSLVAETVRPPASVAEAAASAMDSLPITSDRVPCIVRERAELETLPLDHRAGFLLAHIDGACTVEQILDVSAMSEAEAILILRKLLVMGVIAFKAGRTNDR